MCAARANVGRSATRSGSQPALVSISGAEGLLLVHDFPKPSVGDGAAVQTHSSHQASAGSPRGEHTHACAGTRRGGRQGGHGRASTGMEAWQHHQWHSTSAPLQRHVSDRGAWTARMPGWRRLVRSYWFSQWGQDPIGLVGQGPNRCCPRGSCSPPSAVRRERPECVRSWGNLVDTRHRTWPTAPIRVCREPTPPPWFSGPRCGHSDGTSDARGVWIWGGPFVSGGVVSGVETYIRLLP